MIIPKLVSVGALSATALVGTLLGSAVDSGAPRIGEDSHITLGAAVTAAATIVSVAWFLASKLQKIQDEIKGVKNDVGELKKGFDELPCSKHKCGKHLGG